MIKGCPAHYLRIILLSIHSGIWGGGNRGEDGDEGDEIIFPFILQSLTLTCNVMPGRLRDENLSVNEVDFVLRISHFPATGSLQSDMYTRRREGDFKKE